MHGHDDAGAPHTPLEVVRPSCVDCDDAVLHRLDRFYHRLRQQVPGPRVLSFVFHIFLHLANEVASFVEGVHPPDD